MKTIEIETLIHAPTEKVFDLARSIDAHTESTKKTKERAVAGRTSGLITLGETVTWEARHFGIKQLLTVKITKMERPTLFEDEMIKGAFKTMTHRHSFTELGDSTVMKDKFEFSAPFGIIGMVAESFFLKAYMKKFLQERNRILKELAEQSP